MQPGWYPDPYSHGFLRWWDGTQWTPHTAPLHPVGGYGDNPETDLAGERRAARWALVAVTAGAVVGIAESLLAIWAFSSLRHGFFDDIENGRNPSPPNLGPYAAWELLSFGTLALEILLMIWLYRAATLARRAGLPAKRDPVWAILGFIVPIVNFWFPYQIARDCFDPRDPRRAVTPRWWTWYLIATLGLVPVYITAVFNGGTALVLAALDAVAWVLAAMYGRKLITAVGDAHGELVRHLVDR